MVGSPVDMPRMRKLSIGRRVMSCVPRSFVEPFAKLPLAVDVSSQPLDDFVCIPYKDVPVRSIDDRGAT